jgi:glucosylceramidase
MAAGSARPDARDGASAPVRRTAAPAFVVSSPTDTARRLLAVPPAPAGSVATAEVAVHPDQPRQVWWGTGAALTDASVQLLGDRPRIVRELFAPTAPRGARLTMVRLPLSATDFSPRPWSWRLRDGVARPAPPAKAAAALVRSRLLPLVPRLRVVGAPWSAPAAMKTSGSLRGGALAPGSEDAYADLLVSQAQWLSRHGVRLWATSLGNEPGHSSDYPTMTMTDAQLAALGSDVGPRLDELGTRLWAVDHNWADRPRVDAVLAATAGFDAAAFHCYAGSPGQMAGLAVPRIVTECTGTDDGFAGTFAWDAKNLVADAVAAGSSGLMMWNLALDPGHGPVDAGSQWGCKRCRGLVTVSPSGMVREPEFFTLAQLARAALPGARVLRVTAPAWLSVAAFRNPDGSYGVFGHNRSAADQTVRISLDSGPARTYLVRPGELFSYRGPLPG